MIETLPWKFCSNFRDKFASEYKYKLKMILKVMTQSKNYASTLHNPLDYNNWCIMVIWSQKTDMMCKPACWCLLLKQCSPSKHTDIMSVCSANRCPKTIVIIITHYNTFLRFQQWMVYNPRDATQSYIYKQDSLTDLSTLLITEEKSVLKN